MDAPRKPKSPVSYRALAAPSLAKQPFSKPGWLFELKYDGFRVLAQKQGDRVTLVSRKGTDLLRAFPEIYPALAVLPDLILDGELVLLDEYCRPDFHGLCHRFRLKRPTAKAHHRDVAVGNAAKLRREAGIGLSTCFTVGYVGRISL